MKSKATGCGSISTVFFSVDLLCVSSIIIAIIMMMIMIMIMITTIIIIIIIIIIAVIRSDKEKTLSYTQKIN